MSRIIRVNYEEAVAIIECLRKDKEDIEGYYEQMETIANSIVDNGLMSGDAAAKLVEEFESMIKPDLEASIDIIEECLAGLQGIVDDFVQTEQDFFSNIFGC